MNDYWTTADGRKIKYEDMEDSHLKNIIKDGYRNPNIIREAQRREFKVPQREIDKLSHMDFMLWVETFYSTAISNNELSLKMINLFENDKALFGLSLNKILEELKKEEE